MVVFGGIHRRGTAEVLRIVVFGEIRRAPTVTFDLAGGWNGNGGFDTELGHGFPFWDSPKSVGARRDIGGWSCLAASAVPLPSCWRIELRVWDKN